MDGREIRPRATDDPGEHSLSVAITIPLEHFPCPSAYPPFPYSTTKIFVIWNVAVYATVGRPNGSRQNCAGKAQYKFECFFLFSFSE